MPAMLCHGSGSFLDGGEERVGWGKVRLVAQPNKCRREPVFHLLGMGVKRAVIERHIPVVLPYQRASTLGMLVRWESGIESGIVTPRLRAERFVGRVLGHGWAPTRAR